MTNTPILPRVVLCGTCLVLSAFCAVDPAIAGSLKLKGTSVQTTAQQFSAGQRQPPRVDPVRRHQTADQYAAKCNEVGGGAYISHDPDDPQWDCITPDGRSVDVPWD